MTTLHLTTIKSLPVPTSDVGHILRGIASFSDGKAYRFTLAIGGSRSGITHMYNMKNNRRVENVCWARRNMIKSHLGLSND
jgi:hypothetical protein